MTVAKSLPARPSLDSLRKQAKKLARDVATGDAAAIERARAHLPNLDPPLTQRNAQLVIAREYGFEGWQDLTAEVSKRLGEGLQWAVKQAERAIHDDDVERLKELLAEYPALKSWQHRKTNDNDNDSLLGMATGAYGDAGDTERERWFTRASCAEVLIDAGAVVTPDRSRRAAAVACPWAASVVSPQGPAAAHAEVSGCTRGSGRRSQRSRREHDGSQGHQRGIHLREPLRP